jgi:hypothetical protein
MLPLIRHKFTAEEDRSLRELLRENGENDWHAIALRMPGRDSRQCKERWFHYLSPEIVQEKWTAQDDALLEAKVLEHGHKWKMFETFFPGRVDTNIKNRYNVLVRRKRKEMKILSRSSGAHAAESGENSQLTEPTDSDMFTLWDQDEFDWMHVSD